MRVFLAVYSGDAETAAALLGYINELGGTERHALTLATTPPVDAAPLLALARAGWHEVEHLPLKQDVRGWPQGPNYCFKSALDHFERKEREDPKSAEPFYFMESDCLPLRETWLDELEREYRSAGKPFMGVVHDAAGYKDGMGATRHCNGSAIYPPRASAYLPTAQWLHLPVGQNADRSPRYEPWDLRLNFEMLYQVDGKGGFKAGPDNGRVSICHATEQIVFPWRSRNYRVEVEGGAYQFDCKSASLAQPIDFERHVLHHGCKDASLRELLTARMRAMRGGEIRAPKALPAPHQIIIRSGGEIIAHAAPPPQPADLEMPTLAQLQEAARANAEEDARELAALSAPPTAVPAAAPVPPRLAHILAPKPTPAESYEQAFSGEASAPVIVPVEPGPEAQGEVKITVTDAPPQPPAKRKPGRPPGAKGKPKDAAKPKRPNAGVARMQRQMAEQRHAP